MLAILLTVIVWLLGAPLATLAGNALVEDDGAAKADAIVVLGGDGFGTRIVRAAELATAGYSSRILVCGPANLLGHDTDETIVYASRKGYPASMFEAVPLPDEADSTQTEARFMAKLLQTQEIHSIDLVTSNFHTRRAASIWRKECPGVRINVVPAPDPHFTPETWFQTRAGRKVFFLEATKSFNSYLGY